MDVFYEVKERLSMVDVAEHFGYKVDRRGNILCPFHQDHKPSCKIYKKSFYCFSCSTGGDMITFAAKYLNVGNLAAAKYLAGAFGIILDEPETLRQRVAREQRQRERREAEAFEKWQKDAFRTLTSYNQRLQEGFRTGDSVWWNRYHTQEAMIEHYLDLLEENPTEFYRQHRKEVEQLARDLT